ncbi:MAG TPA: response regulator transcription factor [Ardenticatenaceae bacterium]|nr:response regulator transcription factor [Ardenticatenaceae bacterium]
MTESKPTEILLVEDDATLRETLAFNLSRQGYVVREAANGQLALEEIRRAEPDLVLLDVMLPGLDGLSVARILRAEYDTPIILLTARTGEVDKIVGLESGADDSVTKPFSTGELLARIRALLRRAAPRKSSTELVAGPLRLNLARRRAFHGGRELALSPKEFDLLAELMRSPGIALSRDLLLERVWGYEWEGDSSRTVDVHIRWLREKIEEDPSAPSVIQTVRGVGYRFEA